MSAAEVEAIFRMIMSKSPAERLQLAGLLITADPSKLDLAVSIAERACMEIRAARVLALPDPRERP